MSWSIGSWSPAGAGSTTCPQGTSCTISLNAGAVMGTQYTFTINVTNGKTATQDVTVIVQENACTSNCAASAPSIRFEPASMTVKEGKPLASTAVVDGNITSYSAIVCTPNTGVTGKLDATTGLPVVSGTPTANGECTVTAIGPGGSTKATFYYTVLAVLKVLCNSTAAPSNTTGILPGSLNVTAVPADAGGRQHHRP